MAHRLPKAVRILIGTLLMAAFVAVTGAVLTHFAGGWGVPYFSFRTERGTPCTNGLLGYTCHQMTLPDLEFYGDLELPGDTRVVSSTYRATHDYQLEAQLLVPAASADAALAGLHDSFGPCQRDHVAPMATDRLLDVCVMANDDTVTNDADTSSRLYTVGTGLRPDGSRSVTMSVKSR